MGNTCEVPRPVGDRGGPLAALSAAIDELAGLDPVVLGESDLVLGLLAAVSRLEHVASRQAVAFDAGPEWVDEGAYNSTSWVTMRRRCPRRDARRRLHLGEAVRAMPVVDAAWAAGTIDAAHVQVLAAARQPAVAELFARDEATLVGFATSLSFADFEKAVAYWRQTAAPEDAEKTAAAQREQREVQLSSSFEGMWLGRVTLDPVAGEIVANELRRLERALFDTDWKQTKQALGRTPTRTELPRTPQQRRADALVEMATRSATAPADGRRPAPLVTVLVGYETFAGRICELASGTVISPGSVLGLLEEAYVERVVFGPASRVLDVGKRQRFFTGATRRAIEVRDRRCTHELCETPGEDCEADHIEPYRDGGLTIVDNGRLRCGFHNRRRNHHPDGDGQLSFDHDLDHGADDDFDDGADLDDDDAYEPEPDDHVKTDPVVTNPPGPGAADAADAAESDEPGDDEADDLAKTDPVVTSDHGDPDPTDQDDQAA